MKHKIGRLFVICITILFVTVFSAGCVNPAVYTEVVEEPGYVMYVSVNLLNTEASLEMYFEDDYVSIKDWKPLCETMLNEVIESAKEDDGLKFTEGYIYITIDGVGHTASYTPTEGITYTTGSTKTCPIEIPPSEPAYTDVVEEPGYVMYLSVNLNTETSVDVYFEDDYVGIKDWEYLCETMFNGLIDAAKEDDEFKFTEGYIYITIDGVGHTASYTPTEGITYTTGSTKTCPIEIPPSEK